MVKLSKDLSGTLVLLSPTYISKVPVTTTFIYVSTLGDWYFLSSFGYQGLIIHLTIYQGLIIGEFVSSGPSMVG